MAKTYSALRDEIEQVLQDTSNVEWSTGEIDQYMAGGLTEISLARPYDVTELLKLEGRYGQATATTANKLVDATNDQFLATDVGKVVYNTKDLTWAVVTAYDDAETLSISADIMASGEGYELYNADCWNQRMLNLQDIGDLQRVDKAEYRVGCSPVKYRAVIRHPDNLVEIVTDEPVYNAYEVRLFLELRHRLSQMTDLAGATAATAAAAATSIAMSALQSAGTIEVGQEFSIANERGYYRVAASATIASNTTVVSFWPGLRDSVASGVVVNFRQSTLDVQPDLESIFVDMVAGKALMRKAPKYARNVNVAGRGQMGDTYTLGKNLYDEAKKRLKSIAKRRIFKQYPVG